MQAFAWFGAVWSFLILITSTVSMAIDGGRDSAVMWFFLSVVPHAFIFTFFVLYLLGVS